MQAKGVLKKVSRGLWVNNNHPYFTPLRAVPYLLGSEQGYVSFLTALHRYNIISQISTTTQIASTGHSRQLISEIGRFEFIQLKPSMMREGIMWSDTKLSFQMATLEKALLDTLYISTRKGRRFSSLPELDIDKKLFSTQKFMHILHQQIPYPSIQKAVIEKAYKYRLWN